MKKLLTIFAINIILLSGLVLKADAQMVGGLRPSDINWNEVVEHTLREEQEGKELWEKLQAKQVNCTDFSDHDFGTLGEYFMGQMMGDSHAAMNAMMIQMHGEDGEEQIHIVMGKRLSGCDASAAVPGIGSGWMPMMQMMMGGPAAWGGVNWSLMNFGFMSFGWIFMILWWVLIIAGIVALIKWLMAQSLGSRNHEKSSLETIKERYARGEIDKKEFDEKKKDLE